MPGVLLSASIAERSIWPPGNQEFHVFASPGHTGDIVISYDAAHDRTVIDLYVDKDAKADAEIWLTGNHALGTGDFLL